MNAICGRLVPCWSGKTTRTTGVSLRRASANSQVSGRLGNNENRRAKLFVVRATDGPESSTSMDYEGALKFLGLSENASSEDMVRAKNQMLARYEDQEEKLKSVSACAI